jgi:hypothetical protein
MIDWRAELMSTTQRIAGLEERIASQRLNGVEGTTPLLDVLQDSLRRAGEYRRAVEVRIAARSTETTGGWPPKQAVARGASGATGGNTDGPQPKEIQIQGITINVE